MKFVKHDTITWKEAAVQLAVPLVLVAIVWNVSKYNQTADTEILNGKVTGKDQVWTSCSHSYSCHCKTVTSGSGKRRSSRRVCDTCHEHLNDWDWTVYTTVGNFDIDRVDRRGSYEPARYTAVQINQPAAVEHPYANYVRAAKSSLFHFVQEKRYEKKLPKYPGVYDYQYVNHVIAADKVFVPDLDKWNDQISRGLNDLGAQKQVNVVVVFTDKYPSFAEAIRAGWFGGKKNDVVVVIGTRYPTIKWVRVYSWAKKDIINVALRQDLLESKTLNPDTTPAIILSDVAQYYERRPMSDFQYLEDEIVPPTWVMIFAFIISVGAAIGLGIFFHQNECFEFNNSRRFRY